MARIVHIREIYFYIVCLIALILFIVGIVTVVDSAITYVNPISYNTRAGLVPAYEDRYSNYSKEDIDELIEEEIQNSINNEKAFALKSLIRGGIFIIISIPLFIIHWRKAQAMWQISEKKT
ncbi:hypothetical protein ACFLQQ_00080 [Actinomycetota bacterium]